jgi:shikimate dehydrogenase
MSSTGYIDQITGGAGILTGLIGAEIQGSRSPAMHMREADAQELRLVYRLFDLQAAERSHEDLPRILDAAQATGFAGVNVTHPFKQRVIPLLDELSAEARQIGAVNTVLFQNGRRVGHNTDWSGFAESFTRTLGEARTDKVVQIGAGGAGAATAVAMLHLGCRDLTIHDSSAERASDLVARLAGDFPDARLTALSDAPIEALEEADGLVNATPIGMDGHPGMPVSENWLRGDMWVADVVYFPLETQLLRAAKARGCATLNGGGMAVFQAARAFDLFTGRSADRARMVKDFGTI